MRKIFFTIALTLVTLSVSAQSQNDSTRIAIEQINRIKLDAENYLYAEVTMNDWLEAYNSAKALLKEELSAWLVNTQKVDSVSSFVARSDEHIFEIKALRGNRYRAFVYIKKSDVLSFTEERQLVTVTSDDMKNKVIEEKLFKPSSLSDTSADSLPVLDRPVIETEMTTVTSFDAIESFIKDHKKSGAITAFGKYTSRPLSGTYYMFVYNRQAEIPAYLRCDDGVITNIKTDKADTMDSYKGCGAIWFK